MNGISWREAFMIVGALCALAGLVTRELHNDVRGLGLALIVVGCLMIVAGPVGSMLGFW
jgi:hypothetical protein